MQNWFGAALVASLAFAQPDRALAQDEPDRLLRLNSGFGDANYYFCSATSREAAHGIQAFTEVVTTDARVTLYQMLAGIAEAANPLPGRPWRDVRCHENSGGGSATFQTRQAAEEYRATWMASSRSIGLKTVEIRWPGKLGNFDKGYIPAGKSAPDQPSGGTSVVSASQPGQAAKPATAPSKYVEVTGADGKTIRLSPEVAARNKAAAEEYQRKVEAQQQAVADHDRKLAENVAVARENAAKTAAAMQAHDAQLAASVAEAAAHKAAMDDYNRKLAGASTNDDPNRCITSPETKPGLRGNTEVRVTNGCDQKVDIVICLKRTTGDWLCGANFGILSQRSMTFMSTNATGEIYVDAVTFGSKNKLGRPAGIIK